ncbi:serine/threonine protein kinase [Colletotrichum filicis]|nr:serine/threonine protein kinase [Colletotrichum filicis]
MEALKIMLRFLEDKLLVHASSRAGRCRATDIADALGNTLTRYKRLAESPPAPNAKKDKRKIWYHLRPSRQDMTNSGNVEEVQRWRLSPDIRTNFKGCESSPDGTVLAFWNDAMIMLFKTSSSKEGHASAESDTRSCLKPVGERRSENTEFWKDVKLTSRYLVAATSSGKFRCYIFDIEMAEDLTKYSIVTLQFPEIHLLSIATHEQSLACVLVNDSDFTSDTLLFTARILLRDHDFKSDIFTIETPREGLEFPDQEIYLSDQITVPLGWSAKNTILLLSKTRQEGYIAARPSDKGANVAIHRYYMDSIRTAKEELIVGSSTMHVPDISQP